MYPPVRLATMMLLGGAIAVAHGADSEHQLQLADNTPRHIAFINANLVSAPGELQPNATVIVNNGHIVAIDKKVPSGAKVINLNGKYLYPGFIDSYGQYGLDWQYQYSDSELPQYQIDRYGARHRNSAVHSEMRWAEHFQADPEQAKKWHKNGFTSVHSAWQDGIFQGQGFVASLTTNGRFPQIYLADNSQWLSFDKGSSPIEYPQSTMGSMALIRQVLAEVDWYQSQRKKSQLTPQQSLQAFSDAEQQRWFFKGQHPDDLLRISTLIPANNSYLVGTGLEYERIEQLKQQQSNLILPLTFAIKPTIYDIYDGANLSLQQLRHWEQSPANAATVANADIPFALTMDGIDADKFLPRLRTAMAHGLSAEDALAALTTTPARFLGIEDQLGKIAPGYRADMVISNGDLFNGGYIEAVILQGQWQQVAPQGSQQFAGLWQLDWQQQSLPLSLTVNDQGQLEGQIEQGESVLTITQLQSDRWGLSFQLDTSELGQAGIATITLRGVNNDELIGQLLSSNGLSTPLQASRQSAQQPDDSESPQPPDRVSRITYPNVPYAPQSPYQSQSWHFKNATVWTGTEQGNLTNTDVLVHKGKIRRIGPSLTTPSGYQVIDASDKHLTAGIIDEHSHIAIHGGVNEASDNISAEVRIGDVLDASDINIYRALAGGVTSAQLLHGSANPIGGQAQVIKLRWGQDAEGLKFAEAPPSIKFALGENVKQSNWGDDFRSRYPQTRMGVEALLQDGFQQARNHQQAIDDYQDLSRSERKRTVAPRPDLRLDTVMEVLNDQRHIHVHSYVQSEILMLLDLAKEMDFKVQTFTHILEGYKVAPEMAAAGTTASTFADWWAYKFEVYDAIPHNACLLSEQGVLTSINSDSPDLIRRLNQEAAKSMMYCGMDAESAWQMVTINPAKQLKVDHLVGTVEEGKQADLVLWSDAPLSVYAKAERTLIDGVQYFSLEQDRAARIALAEERQALLAKLNASKASGDSGEMLTPEPVPAWHCDTVGQHMHHGSHQHHDHRQ